MPHHPLNAFAVLVAKKRLWLALTRHLRQGCDETIAAIEVGVTEEELAEIVRTFSRKVSTFYKRAADKLLAGNNADAMNASAEILEGQLSASAPPARPAAPRT